jgi:hypothetical protein
MVQVPTGRSRVFVGSSVEGLSIAYAVQENLEYDSEVTVWSQGTFEPSQTTIESLDKEIDHFDFALFVFTSDDVTRIRGQHFSAVRDNVLFELGLAIGRLGRQRSIILMPRENDPIRLPTDLLGVAPVTYNPLRSDGNMAAALGPACNQMRRTVAQHGPRARTAAQSGSSAAPTPVTSESLHELRKHFSEALAEQNQRIDSAFKAFDTSLKSGLPIDNNSRSPSPKEALRIVITDIFSRDARTLLGLLCRAHITTEQFETLSHSSHAGPALMELTNAGFLIPVQGLDSKGSRVAAYYLPPGLADLLQQLATDLPASGTAAVRHMMLDLHKAGFDALRDDKS